MKKEDVLSILLTFAMGFLVGAYLYATQVKPLEERLATPDAEAVMDFVVIGEAYGDCGANCPQFWVTGNGSYRYIYIKPETDARELFEGVLTRSVRNSLRGKLTAAALAEQSASVPAQVCGDNEQGIDINYRITLEGQEYRLDSCKTAVQFDSDLWQSLNQVWGELIRASDSATN